MNKEIESIINYYINNDVARDKVRDYIEELHNKIDRAIEYIENADWYLPLWEIRDNQPDKNILLEILKDSDVDE